MKILLFFLAFPIFSFSFYTKPSPTITVTWVTKMEGDFSFSKKKSIECEAWCYEWAGTDKITAKQSTKDTVFCYTATNAATHCSLRLKITKNTCIPTIELISIVSGGNKIYESENGEIKIDKGLWKQNILKAAFDINFKNDENDKVIFWKGKIYTKIR